MAPTMVSGIVQKLPLFTNVNASSPPEDKGSNVPTAEAATPKENKPVAADTVSISAQSRRAVPVVKKDDVRIEDAKREQLKKEAEAAVAKQSQKADRAIAKVQFVYNLKGELSIRYMDTADRLVYQIPSELMMQLKEAAAKADASVDTKA